MNSGYIKLWRKIYDHTLHPLNRNREWSGFEAFLDLVMSAHGAIDPKIIKRSGKEYFVNRGEVAITQRQLAERWRWSLDKTNRYLNHLKTERSLRINTNRWFSVITIENYDIYNPVSERKAERKSRSTPNAKRVPTRTLYKEGNESNEEIYKEKKLFKHCVFLTDEENEKLKNELGSVYDSYLDRLDLYILQIGDKKAEKYKSHYATILNWKRRDDDENDKKNGSILPNKSFQI